MNRSRPKIMTPGRAKLNTSIKRRSFGRSSKRISNQSLRSLNTSSAESSSNIKVVVRVRPFNVTETNAESRSIIQVPDKTWLVFDPIEENEDFFFRGIKQPRRDIAKKANRNQDFSFDRVFDGSCPNQEVFEETTLPIVDGLMNGYNCSVFAYGATGAGKTHTMLGNAQNPGISFLMVMELFRRVGLVEDKNCEISVSYLEVYNETIKDLLVPSGTLQIREDRSGVKVPGLSMHKPKSAEDLLLLLEYGNKNRTQHPTDANAESSRSHAVFQIYLKQKDKEAGPNEIIKIGKMSLVDLAGSERASAVKNHNKARLKEGANINQSLLALGSCINALADKKKGNHVPYRNSKLTRILKDSLGGNCLTVMIAAVSPSSLTYEDTYNTLNYASRTKEIKVDLKRNAYSVESHVSQYKRIMESQQRELAQLKLKLKEYEEESAMETHETVCAECQTSFMEVVKEDLGKTVRMSITNENELMTNTTPLQTELDSDFIIAMDKLFVEQIKIRTKMMNFESEGKILASKRCFKEQAHEQIQCLTWHKDKLTRSTQKMASVTKGLIKTELRCKNALNRAQTLLDNNQIQISNLLNSHFGSDGLENNALRRYMDNKRMEVEIAGLNVQNHHILKMLKMQLDESALNFKLSKEALNQVKSQQLLLLEHKFLTEKLKKNYESLIDQVHGRKGVMWADQANINPVPDEYIKNYMLLNVYKFTRESMSPWKRQSQSGLPCNPFSSTPYNDASKQNLAFYHNPDQPGNHSYIQVDSFMSSDPEFEEKLATPLPNISPVESSILLVLPPRGKCGSPFPYQSVKTKPLARSLDDTFEVQSNKELSFSPREEKTPNNAITPVGSLGGKVNLNLQYDSSPVLNSKNVDKGTTHSLVAHSSATSILDTSTPPSPVRISVNLVPKGCETPPSPVRISVDPIPEDLATPPSPVRCSSPMDHTYIMNPIRKPAVEEIKIGFPQNSTFLTHSSGASNPSITDTLEKKPPAFFPFKAPATKRILKNLPFRRDRGTPETVAINIQPVIPMMRKKLSGGVSTPNLHKEASDVAKRLRTFQQPTSASKGREKLAINAKENSKPSGTSSAILGLRQTSIAISRPKLTLSKSKSSTALYGGPGFRFGSNTKPS